MARKQKTRRKQLDKLGPSPFQELVREMGGKKAKATGKAKSAKAKSAVPSKRAFRKAGHSRRS